MQSNADKDVEFMSRSQLKDEVLKLRAAIRTDRDLSGHDLCHHRPELWGLLPEGYAVMRITVPSFWEFMWRCFQYRWNLGKECKSCS